MILIKEEMIGGDKYRRAIELGGSDAIVLWLALKCYCSQHADTEGFVPGEVLAGLPGAPRRARKALEALVDCGRLLPDGTRGHGFVEEVEHGWQLHDYLDHAPPREEIELRKEKSRLRKQSYREHKRRELAAVRRLAAELGEQGAPPLEGHPLGGDTAGHVPRDRWDTEGDTEGDSPRDTEGDNPGVSLAGGRPREGTRGPAPARAGAPPNPTQPNPTKRNLPRRASTIRDPLRVAACAEHRLFASENGLDVDELLEEVRRTPEAAGLSEDEIRTRLGEVLANAAAERRAMGGAA